MSKAPSPLLGYNNNVRHKNKVFHIQTEDSGVKYGHIITHLFMDGGRILKSVKTSYTEYLGQEKMADIVKEMMKQQHKAMFIALRDGKFDHMVEGTADVSAQTKALSAQAAAVIVTPGPTEQKPAAPAAAAPAAAPVAPAPVAQAKPAVAPARAAAPAGPAEADMTQKMTALPPMIPTPPPLPQPARAGAVPRKATPTRENPVPAIVRSAAAAVGDMGPDDVPAAPPSAKPPSSAPPSTERNPNELTLDIDALERAAAAAETSSPVFKPSSDLPPPPTNLFREKTATGKYRTLPPTSSTPSPPAVGTPPPRTTGDRRPSAPPAGAPQAKRYAPTRPASIFGQSRPQQGKTVFGEDLISDKSLDEVILSYLADDLEPPQKK